MKTNKVVLISLTALGLIAAFVVALKVYRNHETTQAMQAISQDPLALVPAYSPMIGPENAPVTLVEFLDPECETCRAFYPIVQDILKQHQGKVRLVVRYAPFHPNSRLAIKILEASRLQNKFDETLHVLYKYQPEWGSHEAPKPELLWTYLPEAGVDVERLRKDMENPAYDELIEKEIAAVRALQVRGTPHFFANGRPLLEFGEAQLRELVSGALKESDPAGAVQ